MSRVTSVLNSLKAENLLAGSYVLTQIETLRTNLKYRTNGDTVSFDDYYLKLQKEVDDIPRLKLETVVATGTENQYILQLIAGMEKVQDDSDRVVRKIMHYQSKLRNALSQIQKLGAAFNAWYTLAAGESLEENGAKFPCNQLKDLAASEFSRLMENMDVEVGSLLEAVKVQSEQIKQYKKTQQAKFELGKDQANASWTSGLPSFGEAPDRADHLLERRIEEEVDEEVPAFVSKKPSVEAITNAIADVRLAGLPALSPEAIESLKKEIIGMTSSKEDEYVASLQAETPRRIDSYNDAVIKGVFVKTGPPVAITPIINDDTPVHVSCAVPVEAQEVLADPKATPEQLKAAFAQEIVMPDPVHAPESQAVEQTQSAPASLTAVFANAKEIIPEVKTRKEKVEKPIITPPSPDKIVTRTEDGYPEKMHCEVCHRRIRVGQSMFSTANDGWAHAMTSDCTGKVTVVRTNQAEDDAPVTGILVPTATAAPAPEGTLLEMMEKAIAVPEKGFPVGIVKEVQNEGQVVVTLSPDVPPTTAPLEAATVVAIPNVDAPATPRKRLTFLEDDAEIM